MNLKVSTVVNKSLWSELRKTAQASHQSLSGLLNEAIREFLQRRRVRPVFTQHMEASLAENAELGRLLAK